MKPLNSNYFIGNILSDLGFDSFNDFITTLIGFKNNLLTPFAFLTGATFSLFIQNNFWAEPGEVFFLASLTAIDLLTGIWKAFKNNDDPAKKFKSRRISRTVGKIITYSLILYIAFNLDKNMHHAFFWMPYSCLCMFYTTEAWSITENLSEIGYLNKDLVKFIKEKLNIVNFLNKNNKDKNSSVKPTPTPRKKKSQN